MASSFPIGKQQHLSRHVAALSEPPPQSTVTSTTLHPTDFGSAACLLLVLQEGDCLLGRLERKLSARRRVDIIRPERSQGLVRVQQP